MFAVAREIGTTVATIEKMSRVEFEGWLYLMAEEQGQTKAREEAQKAADTWLANLATSSFPSEPTPATSNGV